jgi:hypothetical protein
MPRFFNPITLASAGFAIAAGSALFAFSGSAEAASRRMCETNSVKRTASCCEAYLRKPSSRWGSSSGVSCNASTNIVCKKVSPQYSTAFAAGGSTTVCYLVMKIKPRDNESKDHQPPSRDTPSRGNPNGGQTAGNNPS